MWFVATKKEVKEEFAKVKSSFQERDQNFKELKKEIDDNKLKVAKLEGVLSVIINNSQPKTHKVSINPKQSLGLIEKKVMNRVRRSKKAIVVAEIVKIAPSMSVIEMFEEIVLSKGLCSKASFYRYVASLKSQQSQLIPETKTKN